MNDLIERRMKEWQPRRPSPDLRRRTFAFEAAAAPPAVQLHVRDFARWLAPALGCFLMVAATLVNPQPHAVAAQAGPWDEQAMAFSIAAHHSGVNSTPARTLEWTFARATVTTGDSFSPSETNHLTR